MATQRERRNRDIQIVRRWSEFYTHPEICEEFNISDALILIAKKRVGKDISEIDTRSLEERACANVRVTAILESIASKIYTNIKDIRRSMSNKGYSGKHRGYLRRLKSEGIISQDGNFYTLTKRGHSCLQHHYETLIEKILKKN